MQDVLGELNDIAVGSRLLEELGKGRNPEGVGFVRGWFAARQSLLIAQLGAAWGSWKKQAQFA